MPTFLFHCPNTGLNVQARVADDPTEGETERFGPATCLIRTRMHLVNPQTGEDDE
ncbi:MAG: hypothetical protein WB760_34275 [Xanthobacteraceae bacterium]